MNDTLNKLEAYRAQLEKINGIYFTPREIDIIACILSGRVAKRTASLLSISHRTVEQHTRNIMHKISCGSKDGIIEFVEKSDKYNLIKEFYQRLIGKEVGTEDKTGIIAPNNFNTASASEADRFCQKKRGFLFFLMCACCSIIILFSVGNLIKYGTIQSAAKTVNTWNLPRQDHKFVGREGLLLELEEKLHPDANAKTNVSVKIGRGSRADAEKNSLHKTLAISACAGLGGIGKTQLALQYIHHSNHSYTLKAWFPAENLDQLQQKYKEFAKFLGLEKEEITTESAIAYIKNWLASHPGWLIVYDNVESYEEIKPFLPEHGGYILLTTRQRNWPLTFQVLSIDVMSENEAIALIETLIAESRQGGINERKEISDLAKTLGYLPLALAQAGAYIKQNNISVSKYLELYRDHEKEMLAEKTFPIGSDMNLAISVTWNITLSKIAKEAKITSTTSKDNISADMLLTACSYLAPEKISREFLLAWLQEFYPGLEKPELALNKGLSLLWQYSMINYDGEQYINVHRLVQAILRYQHNELKNESKQEKILKVSNESNQSGEPKEPYDTQQTKVSKRSGITKILVR